MSINTLQGDYQFLERMEMPAQGSEPLIKQALEQLNRGNNRVALDLFNQAISEAPDAPGLNFGKAIALARLGRTDKAVKALNGLLSVMPNHKKARLLLQELTLESDSNLQDIERPQASFVTTRSVQWVPNAIYPDDVFIVSYPKSGNTWIRFLIANLLKRQGEEVDFYTVHEYVPEVGKQEELIQSLSRPRAMKSHAPYIREYPRVIYLVRDGRDVYVSYYFHRLKQLPPGTTFGEFLKRRNHFPSTWGEHVASWLLRDPPLPTVLVVKYEDIVHNCLEQLRRVVDFIGIEWTEDRLKSAVEASSFENMRRLELEKGRLYEDRGPDVFMRKGRPGDWKRFFGSEERAVFKFREGHVLVALGYEANDNW